MRAVSRGTFIALAIAVAVAGIAASAAPARAQPVTTTSSGLGIIDTKVGTGPSPKPGQTVVVHYTGWLYEGGKRGKKFDSSSIAASRSSSPLARARSSPAGIKASPP